MLAPMIALKSILVPTDFSEHSMVAVTYGVALAAAYRAKLTLLHVTDDTVGRDLIAATTLGMLHTAEQSAGVRLGRLLTTTEARELKPEYVVRTGQPEVEILKYAQARQIDLIILATHTRGAVAHMLTSNVAERLLRKAPCPVLVVRHPEHEFVMPETAVS
jgi:nucleotide-binding universal stress UspA family protein